MFFLIQIYAMKRFLLLFLVFPVIAFAQQQTVTYTISPAVFEENQSITITFNGNSINEATWGVTNNALYLWAWSFDLNDANTQDCPTNGTWGNSTEANRLTYNSGNDTYSMTFVPNTFYNRIGIGRIGFLIKAKDGSGDKKSQDIISEVGAFQMSLVSPLENSNTIINSGANVSIVASNTGGNATYSVTANGVPISCSTAPTSFFTCGDTNVTTNKVYVVSATIGTTTVTKKFTVIVNPGTISAPLNAGLEDGINYDTSDATVATLVLDAPGKDFVYVAGSFNNWEPTLAYAMKKDPTSGKFWLKLTNLVSGQIYTYQYWVADQTPTTNSPSIVKTADPYSTLVLSPFDDPGISSATYPNLPAYPIGQQREVTVLQTAQTPYNWQVTNFVKPEKENLVIYEVLVRDFDSNRNFQNLIDKIDYFKNLKINAIELMPVMEYEGNESWGYNTAFHLALDKFYGPANKFKEFVDLCHQNGIAVILDLALNHAFGRNPLVRMWMKDSDGDGWGDVAADNPYFNEIATHSYSVGNDFNHSQARTKYYTKRVIKQWIQEFRIDGFRWDLTKGFTQNATGSDANTNAYQQDRVDILKDYADYSWTLDPTHYAIFEHLGIDNEEQQWANYRIGETPSKGVMLWGKMTDQYNQLTMGYNSSNDITRMSNVSRGFTNKRLIGYAESHDEERLMYKNLQFGNNSNPSHNVTTLNVALSRMSALGAATLLIPGPKMIWHFGELGLQNSIYTCSDGSVNTESDAISGNCKLDTKPQPQWTNNWLNITERAKIYNDWAKMIDLKKNNPVFKGNFIINSGTTLQPRIFIWDDAIPSSQLKNVVILTNFGVTSQSVTPDFPYTGTWVNLMDNTTINVTSTTSPITIEAGGFRVYGNQSALATEDFNRLNFVNLYPNPASNSFSLNGNFEKVSIFSITGQLVKSFNNTSENYQYPIEDLENGIYLVKIFDQNKQEKTVKLVKR